MVETTGDDVVDHQLTIKGEEVPKTACFLSEYRPSIAKIMDPFGNKAQAGLS
jgi:hypothetical protein